VLQYRIEENIVSASRDAPILILGDL